MSKSLDIGQKKYIKKILSHISKRYSSTIDPGVSLKKKKRYLCENLLPSTDIVLLSGSGLTLKTNKGVLYDFASMSLNCILGQNDPWVTANLASYILSGSPSFATTRTGTPLYFEMGEEISRLSGIKNAVVNHRQCNGSDVIELAILATYRHRKKNQNKIISFKGSYHGQNLTSFIISDLQQENRFIVDNTVSAIFLNTPTHTQPENKAKSLSENDKNILKELKKIGHKAFAVIIEPVQVNNNVNICSKLFLQSLKKICEDLNIPLIFDDIQTGYGWLGTFSSSHYFGVTPNLMAISKGLTSGYGPLAALAMDPKYGDLPLSTVLKTNGADLRSLVAAKSVIERLRGIQKDFIPEGITTELKQEFTEGLLVAFPKKEKLIKEYLQNLQKKYVSLLGELRGTGLIWCIEILNDAGKKDKEICSKLQKFILEQGVLVRDVKGSLLFKIPLVCTEDELHHGFTIIDECLASI